ncbi:uncharacterized protein SCHCODRAFT_02593332, partial [Schizophyllum commune H4-8]|uniref:uncharacterized protein n=1 Tax=Schizophyllum commune (strain H4-8 / FGSC 9210) TaxID=578458 RepID=UPI00215EFD2A
YVSLLTLRLPVHLLAYYSLYTYPRSVLPPSSPSSLPHRPPSPLTYAHADCFSQSLLLNANSPLCFLVRRLLIVFCPTTLLTRPISYFTDPPLPRRLAPPGSPTSVCLSLISSHSVSHYLAPSPGYEGITDVVLQGYLRDYVRGGLRDYERGAYWTTSATPRQLPSPTPPPPSPTPDPTPPLARTPHTPCEDPTLRADFKPHPRTDPTLARTPPHPPFATLPAPPYPPSTPTVTAPKVSPLPSTTPFD